MCPRTRSVGDNEDEAVSPQLGKRNTTLTGCLFIQLGVSYHPRCSSRGWTFASQRYGTGKEV